jgi:5'(3')-deoxyribonucleotidase
MIILCDVDGVVADMIPAWLGLYNREYGDNLQPRDITTWALDPFVKPECGKKIYQYLHDPALYQHTLAVPGALRGVRALARAGHQLVYLSYCVGPEMMQAKARWLGLHGFLTYGNMLFVGDPDFKRLVRGNLMIDDYEENIRAFGSFGMLFDAPYNRHAEELWRVRGWAGVAEALCLT